MIITNKNQLKNLRKSGKILAEILKKLQDYTKAGMTTMDLENYTSKMLRQHKVNGAFKNFNGYPFNTCISINEELVHTFPSKKVINNGDIISIDCGVIYHGYYSDSAVTFGVGNISSQAKNLISVTKKSLLEPIKYIKPDIKLGDIQSKIQNIIETAKLGLVRDLTGHGIGTNLQEDPQIPNYGKPNTGITLKEGMVFCIEPMVTLGNGDIAIKEDGWSIISADQTLSAHFEHTILVTNKGYEILTK